VEEVNKKVKTGMPFRDAYREVAAEIDSGHYRPGRDHTYTHLGSIGNPGTEQVRAKLKMAFEGFGFVSRDEVVELLKNYFEKS
jgi:argininosuccinate lyase